jgi:hypothetical protein
MRNTSLTNLSKLTTCHHASDYSQLSLTTDATFTFQLVFFFFKFGFLARDHPNESCRGPPYRNNNKLFVVPLRVRMRVRTAGRVSSAPHLVAHYWH